MTTSLTPNLMFNRNMGCIEITNYAGQIGKGTCLIETWDVLK